MITHRNTTAPCSLEVLVPPRGHPAVLHRGRWITLDGEPEGCPTRGQLTQSASRAMAHHALAQVIAS